MNLVRNSLSILAVSTFAVGSLSFAASADSFDDTPQVVDDRVPMSRDPINERLRDLRAEDFKPLSGKR